MTVVLHRPNKQPLAVESKELSIHSEGGGIVQNVVRAAELLGCTPELVDVLACGRGYLIYSVFDYEGEANDSATAALCEITGLNPEDAEALQGPVLVVVA